MTKNRKQEIIRSVFYRNIENIMRDLESCENTHVIFAIGMDMGRLHRDLVEELRKEMEGENADSD